MKTVGVLAFQGSVAEHVEATRLAAKKLKMRVTIVEARTKESLRGIDALIIPGGESTTLHKLCAEAGMWEEMKKIRYVFGTCAGAIMLAKKVGHLAQGQKALGLMDMEIDRNAYGSQIQSFVRNLDTAFGRIECVFIRAPKIERIGAGVTVIAQGDARAGGQEGAHAGGAADAQAGGEIYACEQSGKGKYYLAACFHPEFTTTLFHEHFLKRLVKTEKMPRVKSRPK